MLQITRLPNMVPLPKLPGNLLATGFKVSLSACLARLLMISFWLKKFVGTFSWHYYHSGSKPIKA